MYPRLSDILRDVFGFELPFPIYSFGAMVAIGVLTAAWLLAREFDRLYEEGRLKGVRIEAPDKGKKGRKRTVEASPSVLVGTITVIAVLAGFAGAKIFHILENLDAFSRDPAAMIFSTGGFTFYGGLLIAAVAITLYLRSKSLDVATATDAFAPGLMIAYGIGRIGCHLAGDGDWGIASNLEDKPAWIPEWLWSETYPNNILGMDLSGQGVYPTSIYEFLLAALFFGVLWGLRKHPFQGGWLFALYLIFAGVERFLIEQIRVNNRFDLFGISVTQAEVISVLLVTVGGIGLVLRRRRREDGDRRNQSSEAALRSDEAHSTAEADSAST